jgi:hypothetical protein
VLVTDGTILYLRHKAFDRDLEDATPGRHIVPTGGFLDGEPQHRTCWTLTSTIGRSSGDILVSNGKEYYQVQGFPLWANHSYFDPRVSGYTLFAGAVDAMPKAVPKDAPKNRRGARRKGKSGAAGREMWRVHIPITGKAMAMAGDVLFVAGEPMKFDDYSYKTYVAAYNGELGGRLLAVSATDGKQLAEYELSAAPAWDSMAIADGQLYISLADSTVKCLGR